MLKGSKKRKLLFLSWKWHSSFARILANIIDRYAGYIHPLTPLLICWMDGALIKHSSYRDRASQSEIPVRMASRKNPFKLVFYLMKPRTGRNSFGSPADRMARCPAEDDRRAERTKSGGCQDICTNMGNWIWPSHTRPLFLLLVDDGMWKSCSHTQKVVTNKKFHTIDHFPYYDVHVICRPGLYRYVVCYNRLCLGTCYPPTATPSPPLGITEFFCVPKSNQTTQPGYTYYCQFYSFCTPGPPSAAIPIGV